jgi:hypothetical protein
VYGLFHSMESGLDDFVQLCQESGKAPQGPPPVNVTRVFFKSLDDVRRVLAPHAASLAVPSSLRAQAPEFVPRSMKQSETLQDKTVRKRSNTLVTEKEQDDAAIEQALDRTAADTADIVDSRKLVDTMANTVVEAPRVVISEDQLKLAEKLVKRYQYRVAHRNAEKKKTLVDSQLDITYEMCLKLSTEMQWPNGNYYKMLYIGLVPHLIICVNAVQAYAQIAKKKAKKRLQKEVKQDLDDLNKKMTELK